jgi:N-acetylglucosaminyldiphosphoundecaprenol N-acetyl-beta-D-mannosaminyltransferase
MMNDTVELFNIRIDNVTMAEAILRIEQLIHNNRNAYVITPNIDHIVKVQEDPLFMEIYKNADLVLADGMPLIWASRLLKKPLKEKVSGSDLFPQLCAFSVQKSYKVFFLGAAPGVVKKVAKIFQTKYSNLQIVGTYSPTYGFERNKVENDLIVDLIKRAKPDILFVGVGTPKQEKWIYENRRRYNVPLSLGIGASFDFVAGSIKRAPRWMQRSGLEWFYRFCKEPRRLFKRYFIDDMKFFKIFLNEIFKKT